MSMDLRNLVVKVWRTELWTEQHGHPSWGNPRLNCRAALLKRRKKSGSMECPETLLLLIMQNLPWVTRSFWSTSVRVKVFRVSSRKTLSKKIKTFSVLICAANFYILIFKQNTGVVFSASESILYLLHVSCVLNSVRSFYVIEKNACKVKFPQLLY